jgi:hypothetical protein
MDPKITAALMAAGTQAGMIDPADVALADLAGVRVNEAGEVEGADAAVARLRVSKTFLFRASRMPSDAAALLLRQLNRDGDARHQRLSPAPASAKRAKDMTADERRAAEKTAGITPRAHYRRTS